MKKAFFGLILAVIAMFGLANVAVAQENNLCVPSAAWVETIEHPSVGEPRIINPDYVPATDGKFVVDQLKTKWVWTGGPIDVEPPSPLRDPSKWNNVGQTNDSKGNDWPDIVLKLGKGKASWFYYQTTSSWVEGTPEIGESYMDNPEFIEGWVETINHDAVICMTPIGPSTPVDTEEPGEGTENPSIPPVKEPAPVSPVNVVPEVKEPVAHTQPDATSPVRPVVVDTGV